MGASPTIKVAYQSIISPGGQHHLDCSFKAIATCLCGTDINGFRNAKLQIAEYFRTSGNVSGPESLSETSISNNLSEKTAPLATVSNFNVKTY